jgi:hypothetical protein
LPAQTKISKTKINAFNVAHYRVTEQEPFVMLIRKKSAPLAALMKQNGVECAAFVTAHNPYGKKIREALNYRAHKALKREITKMGYVSLEGVGEDPSGNWKIDPSYLVLGMPLEEAQAMGNRLGQDMVVWADIDAVPEVILLR